jgi:hypothetical protein
MAWYIRPAGASGSRAWIGFLMLTILSLLFLAPAAFFTPRLANGVAYLAGAGGTDYFDAQVNTQYCGPRYGCHPYTTGVLEHRGIAVSWPGTVAPGSTFRVRVPIWPVGQGRTIISGTGDAYAAIVLPLLLYLLAMGFPIILVRWIRDRAAIRRGSGAFGGGKRG